MNHKKLLLSISLLMLVMLVIFSCSKSDVSQANSPLPGTTPSASFVEEFDSVSRLTAKGWVLKNNTLPMGQTGWRQGRYEATPLATPANKKGGFTGPVPYIGFPALSADKSPYDFVSCDITALGDPDGAGGNISAWLISPSLPMKPGDVISFWTRAIDDTYYPVATKDRLQVRANFIDGTTNTGKLPGDVGSFTTTLLDINSEYEENYNGGYPEQWTRYSITIPSTGLPATGITNGRFAFRYYAENAGFFGGSTGANYPSLIGIDSLSFRRN